MTFSEAMDELGLSAPEVAELFGLSPQTIRQMRLDPSANSYRTPPVNWRKVLAEYARDRRGELAELADELERAAGEG